MRLNEAASFKVWPLIDVSLLTGFNTTASTILLYYQYYGYHHHHLLLYLHGPPLVLPATAYFTLPSMSSVLQDESC